MATIIPVASFDCVVFGATGDLSRRKLLPGLLHLYRSGLLRELQVVELERERAPERRRAAGGAGGSLC